MDQISIKKENDNIKNVDKIMCILQDRRNESGDIEYYVRYRYSKHPQCAWVSKDKPSNYFIKKYEIMKESEIKTKQEMEQEIKPKKSKIEYEEKDKTLAKEVPEKGVKENIEVEEKKNLTKEEEKNLTEEEENYYLDLFFSTLN